jgi:hypothetical protein
MSPYITLIIGLTLLFNLYETIAGQWRKTKWYVPTGAAILISAFVILGSFICKSIFQIMLN